MMLEELSLLLASTPADSDFDTYHTAVLDNNVLLKSTGSTRGKSFRYLRELYGLRKENLLFRTLRLLWEHTSEGQPLLAVLCAVARDPLLRATVELIESSPIGTPLSSDDFSNAVGQEFDYRLNKNIVGKVGRNVGSTWTQSGHLQGRIRKTRQFVNPDAVSTAYALFLAYLSGYKGDRLFDNDWVRLLDTPAHVLREMAQLAARLGWLEYRSSGSVTEISFRYFMRDEK